MYIMKCSNVHKTNAVKNQESQIKADESVSTSMLNE